MDDWALYEMFEHKKLRLIDSTEFIKQKQKFGIDAESTTAKNSKFSSDSMTFQSTQKKFSSFGQDSYEDIAHNNHQRFASWQKTQEIPQSFDLLQEFLPLIGRYEFLQLHDPSSFELKRKYQGSEIDIRLTNQEDGVLIEDLAAKRDHAQTAQQGETNVKHPDSSQNLRQILPRKTQLADYTVFHHKPDPSEEQALEMIPYPQRVKEPRHSPNQSYHRSRSPKISNLKRKVLDILENENSMSSKRSGRRVTDKGSFKTFLHSQHSLSQDIYYQVLEEKHLRKSQLDQADSILNASQSSRMHKRQSSAGSESRNSYSMLSKKGSPTGPLKQPNYTTAVESSYNWRSGYGKKPEESQTSWLFTGKGGTLQVNNSLNAIFRDTSHLRGGTEVSNLLDEQSELKAYQNQSDLSSRNPFKGTRRDVIYPSVLKPDRETVPKNIFAVDDNLYFSASSAVDELGSQPSMSHLQLEPENGHFKQHQQPQSVIKQGEVPSGHLWRDKQSFPTTSLQSQSRPAGLKPASSLGWPKPGFGGQSTHSGAFKSRSHHGSNVLGVTGVVTLPSPILSAKSVRMNSPNSATVTFRPSGPSVPVPRAPVRLSPKLPQTMSRG